MDVCPYVTYKLCAIYSKEKIGDIIMFAQFEEEDLLSETCEDSETSNESDDD